MSARLLVISALLILAWATSVWLRDRQRRKSARQLPELHGNQPTVVVVTSRHCGACPAQKHILEQLRRRHPPEELRMTMLDIETELERVRTLNVMTLPSTFLVAADGSVRHVNNGLATLKTLERQVQDLLA